MEGDGFLHGYYIGSITTSRDESAYSDENRFLYESDDSRVNQVQAYYVITHMANWLIGYLAPAEEFSGSVDAIRSDQVNLDYDKPEVESKQLCYSLNLGMQGFDSTFLNVDVFAHEFGHHLVFSLNRQIANGMIHEALADYLAAAFTRDSVIEPSEWPGFDRDLTNDHRAPEDVITKGEYCDLLLSRMEADGVDEVYLAVGALVRIAVGIDRVVAAHHERPGGDLHHSLVTVVALLLADSVLAHEVRMTVRILLASRVIGAAREP